MCPGDRLGGEPGPLNVDGEDAIELLFGGFQGGLPKGDARAGDRDVDLPQAPRQRWSACAPPRRIE
jgi:hypothetical protein